MGLLREYIRNVLLEKQRFARETGQKVDKTAILDKYKDDPNVLVHFSDLDKLGINPQSKYDTPVGIYGYPLSALYEKIKTNNLPFASNRRYLHVFKITGNVVFINKDGRTEQDDFWNSKLEELTKPYKDENRNIEEINKLKEIWNEVDQFGKDLLSKIAQHNKKQADQTAQYFDIEQFDQYFERFLDGSGSIYDLDQKLRKNFNYLHSDMMNFPLIFESKIQEFIDKQLEMLNIFDEYEENIKPQDYLIQKVENDTKIQTPFGRVWNATRLISGNAKKWNKLLRSIGISGVIDYGSRMIHNNEPVQGFALSGGVIQHLGTIVDPYNLDNRNRTNDKVRNLIIKIEDGKVSEEKFVKLMKNLPQILINAKAKDVEYDHQEFTIEYFLSSIIHYLPPEYMKHILPYVEHFSSLVFAKVCETIEKKYLPGLIDIIPKNYNNAYFTLMRRIGQRYIPTIINDYMNETFSNSSHEAMELMSVIIHVFKRPDVDFNTKEKIVKIIKNSNYVPLANWIESINIKNIK